MKLTYNELFSQDFANGLKTLENGRFDLKTNYHIGRIADKLRSELKIAQKEWQKILDAQEWIIPEDKTQPKQPKNPEVIQKLEQEFLTIEFTIDKNPVHVSKIEMAPLTPRLLMALSPILDGMATLETDEETKAEKTA